MPLDPLKYLPTTPVKDEGTLVSSRPNSINFVGAGVTVTSSNNEVTVTIGGVGVGGLLAANNLSDVANAATSRINLGLQIGVNVQAYNANTAFRTDKLSVFAASTSAELAGVISDETGSGALVFGTAPVFTTSVNINGVDDILTLTSPGTTDRTTVILATNGDDWEVGARGSATPQHPNAFYIYNKADSSYRLVISDTGNVAIGTGNTTPSARLHVQSSTVEQLRVGYDASNYLSATVNSTGLVTFDLTGTSPEFTFSDSVNISGNLALGANNLTMTGSLGATAARLTKGWFIDLQVTNNIAGSITGNAATVTTNANLTGHVTSIGNAAVLGSFTLAQLSTAVSDADIARTDAANTFTGHQTIEGVTSTGATGSGKFVFDTSPVLVTPNLGTPSAGVLTNATGLPTAGLVANAVTQTAFAEGSTSGPTTTSTTYVDMTDMSVTVTSTGGTWLIDFSALLAQSDITKKTIIRILVDGSEAGQSYREMRPAVAGQGYTLHSMWLGTIAAGSKVIKVQWAVDNSGTATAISTKRQLRAFELKR